MLTEKVWRRQFPEQVRRDGEVSPHRIAVLDALRRGVYVPGAVRADYPDLKKAYPELFHRYAQSTIDYDMVARAKMMGEMQRSRQVADPAK